MPLRNEADRPRGRQSAKSSRPRTRSCRGTAAPRTRPPSRPAILNTQALAVPGIGCIRPLSFAAPPSGPVRPTGFPSTSRRLHLYMCAFPDWEYVSAYAATGLRPQRTTPLHGYTPTGLHAAAQPNGWKGALGPCSHFWEGCQWGLPKAACICRPLFEIGRRGRKSPARDAGPRLHSRGRIAQS